MLLCNRGLGQGVLGGKPFGGAGWSQGRTGASSSGKSSRLRAAKSLLINLPGVATPCSPVPNAGQAVLTRGASSCHTWLCSTPRPVSLSGRVRRFPCLFAPSGGLCIGCVLTKCSPRLMPSVPYLGVGEATQTACVVNSIPCATHEDHLW